MFDWIAKKLQDRAEGKEEVFSEEDLKSWGDEPRAEGDNIVPANKQFGRHAETGPESNTNKDDNEVQDIADENNTATSEDQ